MEKEFERILLTMKIVKKYVVGIGDVPLLFLAEDPSGEKYIAVLADGDASTMEEAWLYTHLTQDEHARLERGDVDFREAFKSGRTMKVTMRHGVLTGIDDIAKNPGLLNDNMLPTAGYCPRRLAAKYHGVCERSKRRDAIVSDNKLHEQIPAIANLARLYLSLGMYRPHGVSRYIMGFCNKFGEEADESEATHIGWTVFYS